MSFAHPGVYPFACKELLPDEHSVFSLDFAVPFSFKGFVANPENAKGIVVEDILADGKSLLVTGGPIPIEVFYADSWPVVFATTLIPIGRPLTMLVHNTSIFHRLLQVCVFGDGITDESSDEIKSRLESRRATSQQSIIWKFFCAPALRVIHWIRSVKVR